jgi:hypothetical protein
MKIGFAQIKPTVGNLSGNFEGIIHSCSANAVLLVGFVNRKRGTRQIAPGLKVTSRAFGIDRRMPIAQKYID